MGTGKAWRLPELSASCTGVLWLSWATWRWTPTSWAWGWRWALRRRRHSTSSPPCSSPSIPSWCACRWIRPHSHSGEPLLMLTKLGYVLITCYYVIISVFFPGSFILNMVLLVVCCREAVSATEKLSTGEPYGRHRTRQQLIPGSEFPLHQENSNMCKKVFDSSW